MRNYDLSPLLRQWIGFDKLASSMGGQEPQGFPPYNIEKSDDNHYRISLALAGFRQSELNIEVEGPRLTVSGKPTPPEKQVEYLHQGLVCKEFQLTFTLAEHLQVSEAKFEKRPAAHRSGASGAGSLAAAAHRHRGDAGAGSQITD